MLVLVLALALAPALALALLTGAGAAIPHGERLWVVSVSNTRAAERANCVRACRVVHVTLFGVDHAPLYGLASPAAVCPRTRSVRYATHPGRRPTSRRAHQ